MVKSNRVKYGGDNSALQQQVDDIQKQLDMVKSQLVSESTPKIMTPMPEPMPETMPEPMPEPMPMSLEQQTITVDGFNGTVSQLKSQISGKIGQLTRNKKNQQYLDKAAKMKSVLNQIRASKTTSDVETVLKNNQFIVKFKNNTLMGGQKSKKHRKKSKGKKSRKH
jgi:hypothetical protein